MSLKPELDKTIGWELVEKVVALLERSLQPIAKVEHNVKMPVLGKTRTRQCDVVITVGEYPRQTISIVEVQKRKRKPDINTFHGWHRKMQEVGAQHLICVSIMGYPQSIIDEVASTYGPTVRLLTLKQLEDNEITAFNFILPFIFHKLPYAKVTDMEDIELHDPEGIIKLTSEGRLAIDAKAKIFSLADSVELRSFMDLAVEYVGNNMPNYFRKAGILSLLDYEASIRWGLPTHELWLHRGDRQFRIIDLKFKVGVKTKVTLVPITMFEYQQEFIEGALRWVAVGRSIVNGNDINIRIVFQTSSEGFLQFTVEHSEGFFEYDFSPDPHLMKTHLERSSEQDKLVPPVQ